MKKYHLLFLLVFFANIAYSQDNTIKGLITSDKGETLPAANIYTKEFDYNTISDSIGHYKISIDKKDTLYFSYIGYETKKIAVKDLIVKPNVFLESKNFNIAEIEIKSNYWYNVINKAIANYKKKAETIPFEMLVDFDLKEFVDNKIVGSAYFKAEAYNKNYSLEEMITSAKFNLKDINVTKKDFLGGNFSSNGITIGCNLPKLKSNHEVILDSIIKIDTNIVYCLTYFKRYFENEEADEEPAPSRFKKIKSISIQHINIDLKSNNIYYYSFSEYNKNKEIKFKVGCLNSKVEVFMKKINNIMVPSRAFLYRELFKIENDKVIVLGTQKIEYQFSNIKKAENKNIRKYKQESFDISVMFYNICKK